MKLIAGAVLIAAFALGIAGVQSTAQADEKVSLDAVPTLLKDAALVAVPGLVLEKAEREVEKGVVVYELEGTVAGVRYEVEVTADGKVVEVEKGDDDDKDGDDDDKNGHDDED